MGRAARPLQPASHGERAGCGAQRREPFRRAQEEAGLGVRAVVDGVELRLGSPAFCGAEAEAEAALASDPEASVICFRQGATRRRPSSSGRPCATDAAETIAALRRAGYRVIILSGDRRSAVAYVADALGVAEWEPASPRPRRSPSSRR